MPVLYGLHRLGLYLESRDLIYYWHKKPTGGSAYNPLQEMLQPQIRHVIEVNEQRLGEGADHEGAPLIAAPDGRAGRVSSSEPADDAGCRAADPPGAGG